MDARQPDTGWPTGGGDTSGPACCRYRALVELTSDWIWEVDETATYTYVSPKVREMLGYAPEEVLGRTPFDLMPPAEAARVGAVFAEIAAVRRPFERLENVNRHKDGRLVVLETSGVPVFDARGRFCGYRGVDRDVTERVEAERALLASEARFRALVEHSPYVITEVDGDGVRVYTAPAVRRTLGHEPAALAGRPVLEFVHPKDREAAEAALRAVLRDGRSRRATYRARRGDGRWRWVETSAAAFPAADGTRHAVLISRDVTDQRRAKRQLAWLATHDPLTGLPNRRALERALARAAAAARQGRPSSLLFLDLDEFKAVNDTLGHAAGDELLVAVARRLREVLAGGDLLARVGGDEFAALLPGRPSDAAAAVAARLRRAAAGFRFRRGGRTFALGLSVGFVPVTGDVSPPALLRQADAAMYRAKARGGNRVGSAAREAGKPAA